MAGNSYDYRLVLLAKQIGGFDFLHTIMIPRNIVEDNYDIKNNARDVIGWKRKHGSQQLSYQSSSQTTCKHNIQIIVLTHNRIIVYTNHNEQGSNSDRSSRVTKSQGCRQMGRSLGFRYFDNRFP